MQREKQKAKSEKWDTRYTAQRGFTLIELMATIAMATIVILGIGVVLVDSYRGWNRMYDRVFSDVVTDSYVARKAFDAVVRKASVKQPGDVSAAESVELYYYQNTDPNLSPNLDRSARFTIAGNELQVVYGSGKLVAGTWQVTSASSPMTLARNVTYGSFFITGACVRMVLKLDNGSETMTVTCSPVRHN